MVMTHDLRHQHFVNTGFGVGAEEMRRNHWHTRDRQTYGRVSRWLEGSWFCSQHFGAEGVNRKMYKQRNVREDHLQPIEPEKTCSWCLSSCLNSHHLLGNFVSSHHLHRHQEPEKPSSSSQRIIRSSNLSVNMYDQTVIIQIRIVFSASYTSPAVVLNPVLGKWSPRFMFLGFS